jgi:hypothetical protein
MTVVRPNSIAGINSITVQTGQALNIHDASGNLIRNITSSTGISTFASINVTQGSGDLTVGVSTFFVDNSATNVGVGTNVPYNNAGTNVHIHSANTTSEIRFTNSTTGGGNNGGTIQQGGTTLYVSNSESGNIVFENNGSERLRIDSSGRLLSGSAANSHNGGDLLQLSASSSTASIQLNRYTANEHPSYLNFFKSRNASISGQTVVQDDDTLGMLAFYGSDGTDRALGAEVCAQVDGTPGSDDMPSRLVFRTSADGSQSPTERMRITEAGNIGINKSAPNMGSHSTALTVSNVTSSARTAVEIEGNTANCHAAIDFRSNGTLVSAINSRGTDRLQFCTGSSGTVRAQFTSNGLNFGSDNTAATALDDYEEGSFTCTYKGVGSNPTVGYQNQTGYYTKIGKVVYYQIYMRVNSWSGGSGAVYIDGLPFTSSSAAAYGGGAILFLNSWSGDRPVMTLITSNTTTLYIYTGISAGSNVNSVTGDVGSSSQLRINGTYMTDA